jgi:hypothetical protein
MRMEQYRQQGVKAFTQKIAPTDLVFIKGQMTISKLPPNVTQDQTTVPTVTKYTNICIHYNRKALPLIIS